MYNLNNIKVLAAHKKMSLKRLFELCKISEGGFYKSIENNSMNIKTLANIAEVLRVSVSELIDEKIDPDEQQTKSSVAMDPIAIYEPPSELAQCYKIMYEQQKEITELTAECERLKNACAPVKDAQAG